MFTSQDTRKVFQKPNILRKKPKAKQGAQKYAGTLENNLIPAHIKEDKAYKPANINPRVTNEYPQLDTTFATASDESSHLFEVAKENALGACTGKVQNLAVTSEANTPSEEIQATINISNLSTDKHNTFFMHELYMLKPSFGQQDNCNEVQSSLNIESFLVDSPNKQCVVVSNDSSNLNAKKIETEAENKWCLNFMSDDSKDMVTPNFYDGAQISKVNTDISTNPITFSSETLPGPVSSVLEQDIIQSCLASRVVKYKCDMPNCNKSFWNEARLQKHKIIHSRQKSTNIPTVVECPVKKVDSEGVEQMCGKSFPTRDILMKHLNEDHVPEDAAYRCARCGRRFWWATGMRTHLQSPCTRALACTWPGCGRVFRQPCRLREHARAHTGDRPYPCDYPNCGWAFRSASKLVRHARRHTGERRHECAACGRAFPRREHLRDHAARHHARHPSPRACTHEGCDETFANMSSLYTHLKKAHRPEGSKPAAPRKQRAPKKKATTDMLVMTVDAEASPIKYDATTPAYHSIADAIEIANASAMIEPEEQIVDDFPGVNEPEVVEQQVGGGAGMVQPAVEAGEGFGYDLEGRCARTHCTWPLQRAQPEQTFTIEEDTQVEQSEGSESNIYTVRSDLFLHGNVLINEDSEFIVREISNRATSEAEEPSNTEQLDGLDLIDSHPTIDLMQQELMYADAAVDEASFRVFLMNGEELS